MELTRFSLSSYATRRSCRRASVVLASPQHTQRTSHGARNECICIRAAAAAAAATTRARLAFMRTHVVCICISAFTHLWYSVHTHTKLYLPCVREPRVCVVWLNGPFMIKPLACTQPARMRDAKVCEVCLCICTTFHTYTQHTHISYVYVYDGKIIILEAHTNIKRHVMLAHTPLV